MFVLSWDALVVSSDDPSPAVMLSCWQTPAMRRSVLLQGQCHEAMHGELLSLALFPIALLLSNLVLVPLLLVPMKWLLMGRVSAAKLASTHPLRVWATHVWVLLQRSWNVRMVTHMLQGTGVYNSLLRALGYKVRWQGVAAGRATVICCVQSHHQISVRARRLDGKPGSPTPTSPSSRQTW